VTLSLTCLLAPQYQNTVYAAAQPAFFGEIALMAWLVVKGADPSLSRA
jgi:hypothetical protein